MTAGAIELGAITVFVVTLAQLMRTAEAPGRLLTDLALASGVLVGVWFWLNSATKMIPIVMADEDRRLTAVPDAAMLSLDGYRRFGETVGDISAIPLAACSSWPSHCSRYGHICCRGGSPGSD